MTLGTSGRNWIFMFVLISIAPFLYFLFSNHYLPTPDEAIQMQGAARLASGNGYTASLTPQNDLAAPNYSYIKGWPAGYSLIIASLLKVGIELELSVKIIKVFFLLLGIVLWLKLFNPYLTGTVARLLFLSILCPLAIQISICCTDGILWALYPLIIMLMLLVCRAVDQQSGFIRQASRLMVVSFLISVAILLKYLGIAILAACVVWLLVNYRRDYKKALLQSFILSLLPIITTVLIFYANVRFAGSVGVVGDSVNKYLNLNFHLVDIFEAILHIFMLPGLMVFVANKLHLSDYLVSITHFLAILGALILGYMVVVLYRLRRFNTLIFWFLSSLASLLLFLGFVNMFLLPPLMKAYPVWYEYYFLGLINMFSLPPFAVVNYFTEYRYYYYICPLIIMLVVAYLATVLRRRGMFFLVTAVLTISLADSWTYSAYRNHKSDLNFQKKSSVLGIITELRGSDKATPVFVDANDSGYNLLFQALDIPVYVCPKTNFLNTNTIFSRPTLVFVIYEDSGNLDPATVELLKKFSFKDVNRSGVSVYWRKFDSGRLFSQI